MLKLLKKKVNLAFSVNPFYLYCVAFSLAIFVYSWGWSNIFPELSAGLILFFAISFVLFIFAGNLFRKEEFILWNYHNCFPYLNDIVFLLIIILGFMNILFMGYIPILNRSNNYREYGIPVIDPVFNTLSIFFSVWFFQSYLEKKKKRLLIYILIILLIQIFLFRRSTIVWIITSLSFLFLLYKRKINLLVIISGIISIIFFSYLFGLYGNVRSNLTEEMVLNNLGASETFKNSGINYNHYMTYLYVSSPLANLQENINGGNGFFNNRDVKDLFFYCLMPVSLTMRLEKQLNLTPLNVA